MSIGHSVKRLLDVCAAACGVVLLGPAMLAIAGAIRLDTPGGALFRQERLGKDGKPFRLLKFRTMKSAPIRYNPDGSTRVEVADDRVTSVGRYLRGGIDELPQLLNILRGHMSFIGPRPDLVQHRALYTPGEERKLEVLPGITSLPVVLGRNELPWKRRIQIDIWYIDHWSLGLDLKILVQTLAMALGLHVVDFDDVPIDLIEAPG